jgi:hypothetical protein
MRRRTALVVAIAALLAVATSVVTAAPAARLNGRFNVVSTITANNFTGVKKGTKSRDVYTFTARCTKGACARVTLARAGGSSRKNYRSTLSRTTSGTYTGTEGPFAYSCPVSSGNRAATFSARHTIKVTRSSTTGRVTAFTGTSRFTIRNCKVGTFVNYSLKGTLG